MPTKERLAKEQARRLEEKRLDEIFGPLAEQLDNVDLALNEYVQKEIGFYATNLCKHDENGEPYKAVLHPEKPSNDKRADERRAEALRLKDKYPDQWRRGGPKCIAIAEGVDMTNANDNPVRKIQRYRKDFP